MHLLCVYYEHILMKMSDLVAYTVVYRQVMLYNDIEVVYLVRGLSLGLCV